MVIRLNTTARTANGKREASRSYEQKILFILSLLLVFSFWTDYRSLSAFVSFPEMETTTPTTTNNIAIHSASSVVSETETTGNTTATNNNNNNNENQSGPGLFFHVGPVKTGTTSIQCNLRVNPFLKESSYEYLGKDSKPLCPQTTYNVTSKFPLDMFIKRLQMGQLSTESKTKAFAPKFKKMFQKKFKNGVNAIMSGEEACIFLAQSEEQTDVLLQNFAFLLNSIPQQITFQVVYRHFFEWALSIYQYHEIYFNARRNKMFMKEMVSILAKDPKENFLQSPPPKCSPHKLWLFLKERLLPLLDRGRIEVFNFHGDGEHDIATRYICSLPDAQVACQKTKENMRLGRANPTDAGTLHADRITTAAWKKKMYTNPHQVESKRGRVRDIILDHFLNSTLLESQWECLSEEELARSLDLSISIGKEMLGNKLDVEALRSKFLLDKSKKKFCSVNTTAVLEDPGWIDFIRNLTIDENEF